MKVTLCLVTFFFFLGITGCGYKYYEVKEPTGGRVYYTHEVKEKSSGAVTFKDDKTGSTVNLQNSEVKEVSKEKYLEEVKGKE